MLRFTTLLCAALVWSAVARADSSPLDYSKALLEDFKKIRNEKGLPPAEKAANKKIVDKLDHAFDFDLMSNKLMKPREDKFSEAQKVQFRTKFHDVIRAGTFVDTGDFFRKAHLEFEPTSEKDGMTVVPIHVTVPADDTDMVVGLQWAKEGNELRVVDVLLDGDSLVKDYQNQVARIVDKKGIQGLFDNLDERRNAAEKAKVK